MLRDWGNKILPSEVTKGVGLRPRFLPRCCPCCGSPVEWGWEESELSERCAPGIVHVYRIPRPDQTVCCPQCEGRILN